MALAKGDLGKDCGKRLHFALFSLLLPSVLNFAGFSLQLLCALAKQLPVDI